MNIDVKSDAASLIALLQEEGRKVYVQTVMIQAIHAGLGRIRVTAEWVIDPDEK